MKGCVSVFVGFLLIGSCLASGDDDKAFNEYLQKYKIRLGRSDDVKKLKEIFEEQSKIVEDHNKEFKEGRVPYDMALDEYSLLPHEEFVHLRTGYIPPPNDTEGIPAENDKTRGGRSAPTSHNWLNVPGVVKPVQNQGSCGSCWAFAGIGAIEGQMALKLGKTEKLSEQEVIECARNRNTNVLLGCNGGWHFSVYDHAASKNGITTQSYKPYLAHTFYGCNPNNPRASGSKTKSGYYSVQAGNEEAMRQTLYSTGPLYVSFYVSSDFYKYKSGVYTDSNNLCKPSYWNNHGVLLVGYGTQSGIDYWLVKNSWGTSFGESGYFKIQRGKNLCGISNDVSYPALA